MTHCQDSVTHGRAQSGREGWGRHFFWGPAFFLSLFSLEQQETEVVRAGGRTVSHSICLPQLSNREGGGVWIEPQDKEYATADGKININSCAPRRMNSHSIL